MKKRSPHQLLMTLAKISMEIEDLKPLVDAEEWTRIKAGFVHAALHDFDPVEATECVKKNGNLEIWKCIPTEQ